MMSHVHVYDYLAYRGVKHSKLIFFLFMLTLTIILISVISLFLVVVMMTLGMVKMMPSTILSFSGPIFVFAFLLIFLDSAIMPLGILYGYKADVVLGKMEIGEESYQFERKIRFFSIIIPLVAVVALIFMLPHLHAIFEDLERNWDHILSLLPLLMPQLLLLLFMYFRYVWPKKKYIRYRIRFPVRHIRPSAKEYLYALIFVSMLIAIISRITPRYPYLLVLPLAFLIIYQIKLMSRVVPYFLSVEKRLGLDVALIVIILALQIGSYVQFTAVLSLLILLLPCYAYIYHDRLSIFFDTDLGFIYTYGIIILFFTTTLLILLMKSKTSEEKNNT